MQMDIDTCLVADMTSIAVLVESILTSFAILVGAAWGYFKFFKGRTFKQRIVSRLTGRIDQRDSRRLLAVTVEITNVGLSKVPVEIKGTALRVHTESSRQPESDDMIEELQWQLLATITIFKDHEWIEPGEVLSEQHIFILPKIDCIIAKVETKIASDKQIWSASCIANQDSKKSKL